MASVPGPPMAAGQRATLLLAKLRALVAQHWGTGDAVPVPFGAGVGLISDAGPEGRRGWLLVDLIRQERDLLDADSSAETDKPPHGWLGGAVVWAQRQGVHELHVLCDSFSGADARRAALFRVEPALWKVTGRDIARVDAALPDATEAQAPIDVMAFAGIIEEAGAEAIVEGRTLRAEVAGLEVGRVMVEPEDGSLVLEVGVGRHDRLANRIMHTDLDTGQALRRAVEAVREHRHGGAGLHPANQLAPERWLRWVVCRRPELVGASALEPVSGTEPVRFRHATPAIAVGTDLAGQPLVVACSVGIDLDAPALGADARAAHEPGARLVLCVPEGDDHATLRVVAESLRVPAALVTVPRDWRSLVRP